MRKAIKLRKCQTTYQSQKSQITCVTQIACFVCSVCPRLVHAQTEELKILRLYLLRYTNTIGNNNRKNEGGGLRAVLLQMYFRKQISRWFQTLTVITLPIVQQELTNVLCLSLQLKSWVRESRKALLSKGSISILNFVSDAVQTGTDAKLRCSYTAWFETQKTTK